jgi:hypothetical protein
LKIGVCRSWAGTTFYIKNTTQMQQTRLTHTSGDASASPCHLVPKVAALKKMPPTA